MKVWKKFFIGGLASSFLLCGAGAIVGMQSVDFLQVSGRTDEAVRNYQGMGWPWRADEMVPTVADEDNRALPILEAIEQEKDIAETQKNVFKKWEEGDEKEVRRLMAECELVLSLYIKASQYGKADFKHDWSKGSLLLFPELNHGKAAARLLGVRAEIKAGEDDLDGALSDLRASFRIGMLLGQIPVFSGLLANVSVEQFALEDAMRVAEVRKEDANWIRRVHEEVSEWKSGTDFERAIKGEALLGLTTMRFKDSSWAVIPSNMGLDDESRHPHPLVATPTSVDADGVPTGISSKAYFVRYLEANIEIEKLVTAGGDDPIETGNLITQFIETSIRNRNEWSFTFSQILFPDYDQVGYSVAKARFLLSAVVAVLKAAEVKAKTGQYPLTVGEIAPGFLDPVTGEVVGYRVQGETVFVYSFGRNGVDDSGIRDSVTVKDDVAAHFPPKPRSSQ